MWEQVLFLGVNCMSIDLISIGKRAREAQRFIITKSKVEKKQLLFNVAKSIRNNMKDIINSNKEDVANAEDMGLKPSIIDRLILDEERINAMCDSVEFVAQLDDPIKDIDNGIYTESGLKILKTRVPIGVIGVIYEARPNVTLDSFALCLKTSNVVILKGGKEAYNTNKAIVDIIKRSLKENNFNDDCVLFIDSVDRQDTLELMKMNEYIDLLIPRGSRGLIDAVVKNSTVPYIETGTGNCHIYLDESCDFKMALDIVDNAKTSRVSVCNSAESLLIHRGIANEIVPLIYKRLSDKDVECLVCDKTNKILENKCKLATEDDYYKEFLDYKISIKIVDDINDAIINVNRYSSGHSECIISQNYNNIEKFTTLVDAAVVYANASTRFTDGGEFGFGAEIGISTQKLHVRGPVGIKDLTSYKYIVLGNGQIR